jgi:hypothetical protein
VYGWIYRKRLEGCKKEGGKLLVPQAELNRLIGLRDAGTLDDEMSKGQRKGGVRKEKKCVGKRGGNAPVDKKPDAKAAKPAKMSLEKQAAVVMTPPMYVSEPSAVIARRMVSLTSDDVRSLVQRAIALQKVCQPLGLSVYLLDV